MDDSVLARSPLFAGVSAAEIKRELEKTPHRIQRYGKGETIFRMTEPATRAGILLEGRVEIKKSYPNGSQVNISIRESGEMIGPAAVFSRSREYPCDIVALESTAVLMLRRDDLMQLMHRDARIMENVITEMASATHMLQQRLELFSYNGIAQKAAFWLLHQARQTKGNTVPIPGSVSRWAMLMNVSRPSLHRELKHLEAQGVLAYAPPVIEILDQDALQRILNQS